jgi:hypothetical protein
VNESPASASGLDLSEGETPTPQDVKKANELLDDAANRRKYRWWSFSLSVLVVLFFGVTISRLMCAVVADIQHFSPWIVGIFATLVVAVTVVTLSLLRATFSPPESPAAQRGEPEMPQATMFSEALKAIAAALEALAKAPGK